MSHASTHKRNDIIASLHRRVPASALHFTFTRSSGPGGQNVNKVSTRATLQFNLSTADMLTRDERRIIRRKLSSRISKEGWLRVIAMRHRTQRANRLAAVERFFELLGEALYRPAARMPTRATLASRKRRLDEKRRTGQQKKLRSTRTARDVDI